MHGTLPLLFCINCCCSITVNKKFFDNSYTVFGPVDHWVATLGFMSNLIILTKKDKSHCFAELQYIWPKNLANDCPARKQPVESISHSPMVAYCGDRIVQRDTFNFYSTWDPQSNDTVS
jgi:hypothetical protein